MYSVVIAENQFVLRILIVLGFCWDRFQTREAWPEKLMPDISMFFGIIIRMFYNDHPPLHFHAEYQGQRGIFDFDGNMAQGNLASRTAQRLIREWASQHREELEQNWHKARAGQALYRIAPLR